jgi:hypothetical protein
VQKHANFLGIRKLLQERPQRLNAFIVLFVGVHVVSTALGFLPDVWAGLHLNVELSRTIYTAVTAAGAMMAGFAGIVVIFGLTSGSERFRRFRHRASGSLQRTWSTVSSAGFWSMGLGFSCLLLSAGNLDRAATWVLEVALLLLAHSSVRLIWILNVLVGIVAVEDEVADKAQRTRTPESLPFVQKQQGR